MQKLLKIGLLSSVSLLFLLIGFVANTEISYAMSSKSLLGIDLLPGLSVDVLPDSTPTPTPAATQSPQATSTSQVTPVPTSTVLSGHPVKARPASSKSGTTSVKAHSIPAATTGGAAIPVLITIHLPNAKDLNIKIYKLYFILGVGAPLFLISVGTLWLLIKSRINQRRLALQDP